MLTDGVGDRGKAEQVEVVDVAQLLLGSLDRGAVTLPEKGTAAKLAAAAAPVEAPPAPKAEPEPARGRTRCHRRRSCGAGRRHGRAGQGSGHRGRGQASRRQEGRTGGRHQKSCQVPPSRQGGRHARAATAAAPGRKAPAPQRPQRGTPAARCRGTCRPPSRSRVWVSRPGPAGPAPRSARGRGTVPRPPRLRPHLRPNRLPRLNRHRNRPATEAAPAVAVKGLGIAGARGHRARRAAAVSRPSAAGSAPG